MGIELSVIFAYAFGLILLYVLGMILIVPLKYIFKLIINGLIGGVALFLINIVGGFFGISLGINPITALVVGFLGVPGVILLLIIKYVL
ncbi:pro-sigmaK processing inhibitor BofA family protein [Clostridiisalibacter paucivorans]|uniref:pro-sigmaK processing inhibitor BofA family protein n=1 Tax=Clostridiisalibacter paucivorans TaxID=408753 RepID=UPI00196A4DB0|nr:pro-sigmaK processing inhibitor BofA family protein [Clostridiisalibacter paucivorans]